MSGKPWTTRDHARFQELYANTPMDQLQAIFGRTPGSLRSRARDMGLKRSADFLAGEHGGRLRPGHQRGKATRFGARPERGRS